MTTITKPLLKQLREEMNAALAAVAAKHGLVVQVGNATFTETTAKFALEIASADAGATPVHAKAAADYKVWCGVYNLEKDWLGKTTKGPSPFTILGIMPKRQKFPVLVRAAGKEVLYRAEDVLARVKLYGLEEEVTS